MKKFLSLLLISCLCSSSFAQRFEWINRMDVSTSNPNTPLTTDQNGNIYTLSKNSGTATVNNTTFNGQVPGAQGILVTKYTPQGLLDWGVMVNPNGGGLEGRDIAVDESGYVYFTIYLPNGGSAHLPDTILPVQGGAAGMIIKLTPDGDYVRDISFTNQLNPEIDILGTDVYLGLESGIQKRDSTLSVVWTINQPNGIPFFHGDLFAQANGKIVVTGYERFNTIGNVAFGNDSLRFTSPGGFNEAIIVYLDTNGTVLNTHTVPTLGVLTVGNAAIDMNGNYYASINALQSPLIFANDTLDNGTNGEYNCILMWDSAGIPIRGFGMYGTGSQPRVFELNVNNANELLFTGFSGGNSFSLNGQVTIPAFNNSVVCKLDTSGNIAWYKVPANKCYMDGIDIRNGNEYLISGDWVNTANSSFDCLPFTSAGAYYFITLLTENAVDYPVADFTYTVNNDTVYSFQSQSQNATSLHWDFGNGDTSILSNPTVNLSNGGNYVVVLTAINGACTDQDTLLLTGVGIAENEVDFARIYPNPVTGGVFTIRLKKPGPATITLQTLDGKKIEGSVVKENAADSRYRVTLPNSYSGIVLIKIETEKGTYSNKLMVR